MRKSPTPGIFGGCLLPLQLLALAPPQRMTPPGGQRPQDEGQCHLVHQSMDRVFKCRKVHRHQQ